MRIAIVTESFLPRSNGVTNSVIHVSRELCRLGHDVTIVCADSYRGDRFERCRVLTLPSKTVPGIGDLDVALTTTARFSRILSEIAPDVVHLASPFILGGIAIRAARRLSIPTVAVFQTDVAGFARHYGLGPLAPAADAVVRSIHSQADISLVPSSSSDRYLRGLGVDRVETWTRGVDTSVFDPSCRDDALRQSWCEPFVVGFLGRLAPEKGVGMLAVLRTEPGLRVVIIGDGPQRGALMECLPEATFVGRRSGADLARHVASLDVLVAPGEHETFCQVIQEGMASGVAVVAPDVGGPQDLIRHGEDGLLYVPGSRADLRRQVAVLHQDPELCRRLALNGRLKVQSRTWPALTGQLMDTYTRVLGISPTWAAAA